MLRFKLKWLLADRYVSVIIHVGQVDVRWFIDYLQMAYLVLVECL